MATQTTQTQVIIPEYIEKPTEILANELLAQAQQPLTCLLYTSPSPRDVEESRMPSSA